MEDIFVDGEEKAGEEGFYEDRWMRIKACYCGRVEYFEFLWVWYFGDGGWVVVVKILVF